jgi:hypothetical protein
MPDRFQDVFSSPLPELEAIRNRHPLPSLGHWFCKRRGMLGQRAFFHILASYSICNVASIVVTGGKSILGVHAIVHLYAAADSLALRRAEHTVQKEAILMAHSGIHSIDEEPRFDLTHFLECAGRAEELSTAIQKTHCSPRGTRPILFSISRAAG